MVFIKSCYVVRSDQYDAFSLEFWYIVVC